jgi:hypothetical protein
MTKEKIKQALKYVLPTLLALGVAYGYVQEGCVCSVPELEPPVVEALPDGGMAEVGDAGR